MEGGSGMGVSPYRSPVGETGEEGGGVVRLLGTLRIS